MRCWRGWLVLALVVLVGCNTTTSGFARLEPDGKLRVSYCRDSGLAISHHKYVLHPEQAEYHRLIVQLGELRPGQIKPLPEGWEPD